MSEVIHPLTLFGGGVFMAGVLLVLVLVVQQGGADRSVQFQVLGEIWSGIRGSAPQWALRLGVVLVGLGAILAFTGVAAKDGQRAQACESRCVEEGFASARIGPNSDRSEDRSTWWVACICESPGKPALELPADSLGGTPD